MRIGHGFDIHRLGMGGNPLVLGGVNIPFAKGIIAHSDGDVLMHAICDALLGAAALGDIGRHFPDTDPRFKSMNSRELLRQVLQLIKKRQFIVVNMDATIIAEAPKLAPYIEDMRAILAQDLQVEPDAISIKAKTMEKLGPIGAGDAIAAHVVVLLKK